MTIDEGRSAGGANLDYDPGNTRSAQVPFAVWRAGSPERRARHRSLNKEPRLTEAKHTSMRVRGPHYPRGLAGDGESGTAARTTAPGIDADLQHMRVRGPMTARKGGHLTGAT